MYYIVFEKKTKKFLTISNSQIIEHDGIVIKEVENFDISKDRVVGNLDDYKIIPDTEGIRTVRINDVKSYAGVKIQSEYPIHKQLNIICGQLNSITESLKLKNNEDYDEMFNYINSILIGFEDRCKYLSEDKTIIFIDDEGHEIGTHQNYEESMTRDDLAKLEKTAYDLEDRRIFNATQNGNQNYKQILKKQKSESLQELNKKE
jgi:hypothetical protein|tara:strand:+ start:849 stop:1460 length:612 start_codon:yes stop_codon:yes gene_type:complete